jgi:hypothetical protein
MAARSRNSDRAQPILDGSEMAPRIGAMFECFLGSAKICSGRSANRTASNDIAKVQGVLVHPEGATWIDMAFVSHHGRADMSETENKARVDAGSGRTVGVNAVVSDTGKAEKCSSIRYRKDGLRA